jgi:uncharacterized DUF497 family protein
MILVNCLIWDDWNKKHITKHNIEISEIEEVFQGKHKTKISYRKRILIIGYTKKRRRLAIVLSPEDKNLIAYEKGTYYIITAFEKEK